MAFDDIKDKGLLSSRGGELLRTRQERMKTRSVEEAHLIEKIARDQKEIEKLTANMSESFEKKLNDLGKFSERVQKHKEDLSSLEVKRVFSSNKQFMSGMRTAMSNRALHEDISQSARAPTTFSNALEIAKNMTTAEIQAQMYKNRHAAARQSANISEAAEHIEGNEAKFERQLHNREKSIQQAGMYQAALGAQKKLGLDMESRYYRAADVTQKAIRERAQSDIAQGVQEGRFGSKSEVETKLASATERLINTFEKLNSTVDKSSKEAAELANEFDKVEKEFNQHKMVLGEMGRGGGGGGGSGLQTGLSMMGNIGSLAVTGANMYRDIRITSELQKMQNSVGFAQVQNTRFQDAYGAGRGDMSAVRRVLTDQASMEAAFGNEMGEREGIASGVQAAGRIGQAGGALKDSIDPAKSFGKSLKRVWGGSTEAGPVGGAANVFLGAAADASPTIAAAGHDINAYLKKIPQEQTALQAQSLYRQREDTINQIGDQSSQEARDVTLGTGMATRGLGSRREGVLRGLTDAGSREALARETGMSSNELISATRTGTDSLGSEFGGVGDIRQAGQLSRAGYFNDANQALQARGMLSEVGGGQKDLENILRNAVANGMDSSKSIMEMVSGIVSMSEKGAGLGIDMSSGVTETLGRAIDAARGRGVSENMAGGVARNSAALASSLASNSDLNFHNVLEFAEIGQQFPGMNAAQKSAAAKATPEQLDVLDGLSGKAREDAAARMGLLSVVRQPGGLKNLRKTMGRQGMMQALGGVGQARNASGQDLSSSITNKIASGEQLTLEEIDFAGGKGFSPEELSAVYRGGPSKKKDFSTSPKGGMSESVELDKASTALTDAKMFAEGAKRIEKAAGSFDSLGKTLNMIASKLDVSQMADATGKAAEDHGFSKGQFDTTIKPFTTAVDTVVEGFEKLMGVLNKINSKYGNGAPGSGGLINNPNPRQPLKR